jgi:hypothetical protein
LRHYDQGDRLSAPAGGIWGLIGNVDIRLRLIDI